MLVVAALRGDVVRFRFMLAPIAIGVASAPMALFAETFLTLEEAQDRLFPGAQFTAEHFTLTAAEVARLREESGTAVLRAQVQLWRVSDGGWFFLDQVLGRDDRITYAVGLDSTGAIKGVEVLVCAEGYEQVRDPAWRRLFLARQHGGGHLMGQIPSLSGATLSAAHISDGVTRVLATYGLFVAPRAALALGQR